MKRKFWIIQQMHQLLLQFYMKHNYNKNSKQIPNYRLHGSGNKRSASPLLNNNQGYSQSNNRSNKKISHSPYQRAPREFESYGKSTKRKAQPEKEKISNKFRIVTEPVDDRIIHLAQSNIFSSSLALRNTNNASSKKNIDTQIKEQSQGLRLNLRQNTSQSRSKQKGYSSKQIQIYTNSNSKSRINNKRGTQGQQEQHDNNRCRNCQKFSEELEYLQLQIKKMIKIQNQWKNGEIAYDQISHAFNLSSQKKDKLQIKKTKPVNNQFMFADTIIKDIKFNMIQLIKDIESLTSIDYPKMLSMDIFTYEPMYYEGGTDPQQNQIKSLLGQLRSTVEGKTIEYDTMDTQSENTYTKMIMRNMKSRLGQSLRDNLELKIKIAILQKSQQISEESQEYLRLVIEEVISSYCKKKY